MSLILPFPYQWNAEINSQSQAIATQYQAGVRQSKRRHQLRNTLNQTSIRVVCESFPELTTLENFLVVALGTPFQLSAADTRLWRCTKYSRTFTGEEVFSVSIDLVQVYAP